ncbi:MAG TPA: glycolate oxidase subunit GlcE [Thiobacillaceae bacterium]|nr:glycolate oxidase subunit GlcE [Thiobacillaceae bacterium]HNU65047.1 glycolate oxidase subunit GlcE [Thiobacillaceae bacterium]
MDCALDIRDQVRAALADRTPLAIRAGGSKAFYGCKLAGEPLDVKGHAGIVDHAPTELVVTARCGTPLAELEAALAEQGQMLPCEPPQFSASATVGGMVAAGLSGPRRPWGGAVRDAVLGVKLLTGRGEILKFGGQVMKNVAGYDVSRLLAGSLGNLGVVLEVSLKVLPRPAKEITLVQEADAQTALARLTAWQGKPWPLSASLHDGERLWVRLSGAHAGVNAAREALGGEEVADLSVWTLVREQGLPFFQTDGPLWRLSVPPATPGMDLPGTWLTEWGGAQRWLRSDAPATRIHAATTAVGGHATLFRGHDGQTEVFQPLSSPLMALHQRLKAGFDPAGILNRGVLYQGL